MYKNVGEKIKIFSKIFLILGIISSIVFGVVYMTFGGIFILWGFLIANGGSFLSLFFSFIIYGYGTLVSNSNAIKKKLNIDEKDNESIKIKRGSIKDSGGIY